MRIYAERRGPFSWLILGSIDGYIQLCKYVPYPVSWERLRKLREACIGIKEVTPTMYDNLDTAIANIFIGGKDVFRTTEVIRGNDTREWDNHGRLR